MTGLARELSQASWSAWVSHSFNERHTESYHKSSVLGMAALGVTGLWLWMRYKRTRRLRSDALTVSAAPVRRPDADSEVRLLADAHPFTQSPGSSPAIPLMFSPYAPLTLAGDVGHAPRAVTTYPATMRNLARSVSISSLPNPHDPEYDATGIPPLSRTSVTDRDLPPLPESTISHSVHPPSEESSSYLSDLSRGQTYASRHTTATTATRMSLHDEMAQYQKRLEVHHEKELGNGGGSGLPVDPPPVYRAEDPPI